MFHGIFSRCLQAFWCFSCLLMSPIAFYPHVGPLGLLLAWYYLLLLAHATLQCFPKLTWLGTIHPLMGSSMRWSPISWDGNQGKHFNGNPLQTWLANLAASSTRVSRSPPANEMTKRLSLFDISNECHMAVTGRAVMNLLQAKRPGVHYHQGLWVFYNRCTSQSLLLVLFYAFLWIAVLWILVLLLERALLNLGWLQNKKIIT